MAELNAKPQHVARQAREVEAAAIRDAELRRAQAPLIEALQKMGVVESVWNLVNTREAYPQALPVLLEHVQRPYPDVVREGCTLALGSGP